MYMILIFKVQAGLYQKVSLFLLSSKGIHAPKDVPVGWWLLCLPGHESRPWHVLETFCSGEAKEPRYCLPSICLGFLWWRKFQVWWNNITFLCLYVCVIYVNCFNFILFHLMWIFLIYIDAYIIYIHKITCPI